ncbi:hypothetical protein [Clostridiisalibacter paucivorans]|uniref:hypothetical protein n=1 Tax=Clostridiisalibacter paucivorans TaxID=408753 RepID=UPI00047D74E4|nr:hypothetical protein [Clostridiisalibacter paucivorans]
MKNYRDYKLNLNINHNWEIAYIPGEKYKKMLDLSKASIHIYLYLTLKANKGVDLGFIRNLTTINISKVYTMPLRTVQQCMHDLEKADLISRTRHRDGSFDVYIQGFENLKKDINYIKVPGFVFHDKFLKYNKADMIGLLDPYFAIYKDTIASIQQVKNNSHLENWQVINKEGIRTGRIFTEDTLLKKIKRVSKRDLDTVIRNINDSGFMQIVDLSEKDTIPSKTRRFMIKATNAIKSLFKPKKQHSFLETNKLNFKEVYSSLRNLSLENYFVEKKELEDLTQMHVQYGQGLFLSGLLSLKGVIQRYSKPVNDAGEEIKNLCSYIRVCIENFLIEIQETKNNRFKNLIIQQN